MIEAIIGRETPRRRLMITVGERHAAIGNDYSVPQTVSRQQCLLQIDGDNITVTNLKPEASPIFVNGMEVISKVITASDHLQIGKGIYNVDIQQVLDAISKMPNPEGMYSITHLREVWDGYENTKRKMMETESRKNAIKGLGSVFMMLGAAVSFMLEDVGNAIRIVFVVIALALTLVWIIPAFKSGTSMQVRMDELNKQLRQKYICPNPECQQFLGLKSVDELLRARKCPHCKSKFSE